MLRGSDASDAEAEARQLALGPPNELAVLAALSDADISSAPPPPAPPAARRTGASSPAYSRASRVRERQHGHAAREGVAERLGRRQRRIAEGVEFR